MIKFCSNIKASANINIIGVYGSTSCLKDYISISSAYRIASLAIKADILLNTLSGLKENKLFTAKLALIVLSINTFVLTRLYRAMKYSLPIVFIFPCSSLLTWSR